MKHLQENTKTLEKYMGKVHEELKMRIKFCKQKITERELVLMLLEYVDHQSLQHQVQDDKENTPINLPKGTHQQNAELMAKTREVQALKEQMRVEDVLTRQFFKQLKREGMVDPAALRLSYRDISTAKRHEQSTPLPQFTISQSFATSSFEAFDAPDRVLASPQHPPSIQAIPSKQLGRVSRITSNSYQELNGADSQRQKSKTFARLRKVEALFCRDQKKTLSRNKSMAESWGLRTQQCISSGMAQQNQNLKAIQNNLVTHLQIMQRYKKAGSIEEVVQREQRVRRKEVQLMELQRVLERREKQLNNSRIQTLKRQRSIKLL